MLLPSADTRLNTEIGKNFMKIIQKKRDVYKRQPYPFSVKEKEIISQVFENPEEKHLYSHKLIMHHVDWLCTVEENRSTLQKKVKDSGFQDVYKRQVVK